MTLQQLILTYKKENGLTLNECADQFHVTRSTIARWMNGQVKTVNNETFDYLKQVFGERLDSSINKKASDCLKPILGQVKAGYHLFAQENHCEMIEVTTIDNRKGDYFLQITGNSMRDAGILDGSLVYVKQCHDVNNGDIAIVLIAHEEVTVKRIIKKPELLILEAANGDVENRYFTAKEVEELPVEIIGKVIYCRTDF